jgi:predicted nucleic acid-binding protein
LTKESKKPRIILDTNPLITFFAKQEGWEKVQEILTKIEEDKIEAAISVVTFTEIYYKYVHEKRPDLAKTRTEEIKYATYIRKLNISQETAITAGEFKGKYHIPIADAYIAAAAYAEGLTVISHDSDFAKISEIKSQTEKEFTTCLPK